MQSKNDLRNCGVKVRTIVFTLRKKCAWIQGLSYVMRAGFEYPSVVSRCDATSLCAIHDEISTIRLMYPIVLVFRFDPTIVLKHKKSSSLSKLETENQEIDP